jgi:hypothetical protein
MAVQHHLDRPSEGWLITEEMLFLAAVKLIGINPQVPNQGNGPQIWSGAAQNKVTGPPESDLQD